jgi:virginiamycin B lyase
MALPVGPQTGTTYTLTGPDGAIAVFNDSTDPNYVGAITEISGFESPEVRQNAENIVGMDGGIHGNFYYGPRPITLTGTIYNVASATDRNEKLDKLTSASNAMRADATLEWTPSGGEAVFMKLRRAQPLRVTGSWSKDFQISMVAADPRIYSVALQTATITQSTILGFVTTGTSALIGIVADASFLYWCNTSKKSIARAKLNGTGYEPEWIKATNDVLGVTVDGSHVYWCSAIDTGAGNGFIGRATLAGGTVEQAWISGITYPVGVAVDAAHIYWCAYTHNAIGRAAIGGGTVEQEWIKGAVGPQGIDVNAAHVYWGNRSGSAIGRAALAGTSVEQSWITGGDLNHPTVDATHIYWSDSTNNRIGRALLAGSNVEPAWQAAPNIPFGVAVNATNIFWAGYSSGDISRAPITPTMIENQGNDVSYPILTAKGIPTNPGFRNQTLQDQITFNYASSTGVTSNQSFATGGLSHGLATDGLFIYYGNRFRATEIVPIESYIGRVRVDGSENLPKWRRIHGGSNLIEPIRAIALHGEVIYFTNESYVSIFSVPASGVGEVSTLATPTGGVNQLAVEGTHIYWTNRSAKAIGRCTLAGGTVEHEFVKTTTAGFPQGIAADAGHLYWSTEEGGKLGRSTLAGGTVEQEWLLGAGTPVGLAVDASNIYWANLEGAIGRATITGESPEPTYATGAYRPIDVAVTPEAVFWNTELSSPTIGRFVLNQGEATIIIDTLNRTAVLSSGESIYRTVDFANTEWWGLQEGPNAIGIVEALIAESFELTVSWRNAWV